MPLLTPLNSRETLPLNDIFATGCSDIENEE
jgi:hypothetical protein